jgi:GNAT superfamily N-acetyltransferase
MKNGSAMSNFIISTDKEKLDVTLIHWFLSTASYWNKDVPLHIVKTAIEHSLNFGVYDGEQQVGYARVLTDFAAIVYLGDVFILPAYRGKGLSKLLMKTIMSHPPLQGMRRWILLTGDAHGLYEQFGWSRISDPTRWMEIQNKNIYQAAE